MYIFLVLSFSSGYCIVQIYKATANRVGPSNEKSYEKTSTTEVHSGTYVLTEFCKASADTFRVFQELVSTFVDAAFLKKQRYYQSQYPPFCDVYQTDLLSSKGLGGEVVSAVVKATLDKTAVQSQKVFHLSQLSIPQSASATFELTCLCSIIAAIWACSAWLKREKSIFV